MILLNRFRRAALPALSGPPCLFFWWTCPFKKLKYLFSSSFDVYQRYPPPALKSEFANAPDVRPMYETLACDYVYQFKILSDNRPHASVLYLGLTWESEWEKASALLMYRSAKFQSPPNAVYVLWSCEGLWRCLYFVISRSVCHLTI